MTGFPLEQQFTVIWEATLNFCSNDKFSIFQPICDFSSAGRYESYFGPQIVLMISILGIAESIIYNIFYKKYITFHQFSLGYKIIFTTLVGSIVVVIGCIFYAQDTLSFKPLLAIPGGLLIGYVILGIGVTIEGTVEHMLDSLFRTSKVKNSYEDGTYFLFPIKTFEYYFMLFYEKKRRIK